MAQWQKGYAVVVTLADGSVRKGKIHRITQDGKIVINVSTGGQVSATADQLSHDEGLLESEGILVKGLLPDPPAAIERVASGTRATVLPSPMAPETNKSGIVPDGKVKYAGSDGFLHEVPAATSHMGRVDSATRAVRED